MKDLVLLLKEKNLSISSVESFTGGLFASTITSIPGASKVYYGSLVSYDTSVKENLLKIGEVINQYGVISKECAQAMAVKGQILFKTDLCISFTGNAGPDVMEDKAVGLSYVSIAYKDKIISFEDIYKLERNGLRLKAVEDAIKRIKEVILG